MHVSGEKATGLYSDYQLFLRRARLRPGETDQCFDCPTTCIFTRSPVPSVTVKSGLKRISTDGFYKPGLGLALTLDGFISRFDALTQLRLTRSSVIAMGRGYTIVRDHCEHGRLFDIFQH